MQWYISNMYGCWIAENAYGFSVWAKSLDELEACFGRK